MSVDHEGYEDNGPQQTEWCWAWLDLYRVRSILYRQKCREESSSGDVEADVQEEIF